MSDAFLLEYYSFPFKGARSTAVSVISDEEMIKIFEEMLEEKPDFVKFIIDLKEENKQLKAENKKFKETIQHCEGVMESDEDLEERLKAQHQIDMEELKAEIEQLKEKDKEWTELMKGAMSSGLTGKVEELTINTEELFGENQQQQSDIEYLVEALEGMRVYCQNIDKNACDVFNQLTKPLRSDEFNGEHMDAAAIPQN